MTRAILLFALCSVAARAGVTYTVTAVTAPAGASMTGPAGALPSGILVGTSSTLVYNPGGGLSNVTFIPLGFTPTGVNNSGQITGQFALDIYQGYPGTSYFQNYFYNGTGWYGLNDPYIAGSTSVIGMDAAGDVTGTVLAADGTTHTLVWNTGGSWVDLNSLNSGYFNVNANAVSSNGLVTGSADGAAFYYNGTTLKTLSGNSSQGNGVNTAGEVVGETTLSNGNQNAFISSSLNNITDIGTLGGLQSDALGVNSLGAVVGWADTSSGAEHAFLYAGGIMTDLNTLLGVNSDWTILSAISINNAGMILASAINTTNGQVANVLLSPTVPEPSTWLLFAGGIAMLMLRKLPRHRPALLRYSFFTLLLLCSILLTGCRKTPEQQTALALKRGQDYRDRKEYAKAILEFRIALKNSPANAEAFYQAGITYMEMLDIPAAYINLKKAVEINPKHIGAQARLAELFSASHDPERLKEAQKTAEDILKISPNDAGALNTLAITKFQLGDDTDAERALRDALSSGHADDRTVVNLALMRRYKGDIPGSLDVVRQGVSRNPKSSGLALVLARMYSSSGDMANAEKEFLRATVVDPHSALCWSTLASFYAATNRPAEAEKAYRAASHADDPKYKHFLAMYYWSTGKSDAAIQEFRRLATADPTDREARARLVSALRHTGKESEADAILQAAFTKNPKDKEAVVGHAQSLVRQGKLDESIIVLRQLVTDSRESYEGHYLLAKVYAAKRLFNLQQQELDQALQVNPNFLAARLDLSQSHLAGGKIDAALDILNSAPKAQKSTVPWMIARNWALLSQNDLPAARAAIEETLKKGASTEAYLQRAFLEIRQKQLPPARADLNRVLAAQPANVRALDALGSSYLAENNMPAALKAVAEQAAKQPKNVPLQFDYSLWLSRAGRLDDSQAVLQQARQSAPDDYAIDIRLGELSLARGDSTAARNLLEPVLAKNPKIARAQMLLGHVEYMTGHENAALMHYRAVSDLEPDNSEALNNLAAILATHPESVDQALDLARKAKQIAPDDPNVSDTLGWVLYRKGFYTAAVPQLEAAKTSTNPVTRYHLAMAYAKTGDTAKAEQIYAQAHKLAPQLPEAKETEQLLKQQ